MSKKDARESYVEGSNETSSHWGMLWRSGANLRDEEHVSLLAAKGEAS